MHAFGAGGMSGSDVTERRSREVHVARVLHVGRAWAGGMSGSDVTERQSRKVHVARVFHVGGELGAEGMSGSGKEAYVWIHGSSQPREI